MPSFSYRLVLFALRIKGIKKTFAGKPLNVDAVRKEDVLAPPRSLKRKHQVQTFRVMDSAITSIQPKSNRRSDHLIFYCHGGAFISGPSSLHWQSLSRLAQSSGATVWLIRYPKAPESQIDQISANIDAAYQHALKSFSSERIALIGDSAGGTLIMGLTQRLIQENQKPPGLLIPITPVADSSLSNPDMKALADSDPILVREGLLQAKQMVAGKRSLKDPLMSPIYGDFTGFPQTYLFVGGKDILGPDALLIADQIKAAGVPMELIHEEMMPHIWPLLPVMKEADLALKKIELILEEWIG